MASAFAVDVSLSLLVTVATESFGSKGVHAPEAVAVLVENAGAHEAEGIIGLPNASFSG